MQPKQGRHPSFAFTASICWAGLLTPDVLQIVTKQDFIETFHCEHWSMSVSLRLSEFAILPMSSWSHSFKPAHFWAEM